MPSTTRNRSGSAEPAPSLTEKLGRGNVLAAGCPSRVILQHLTSRWGVLVMIALRNETLRFSELRRRIEGINERMLTQTLHWLEADTMVHRHVLDTADPHVEYSLTSTGLQAAERLLNLVDWLEMELPTIVSTQESLRAQGRLASSSPARRRRYESGVSVD